MESVGDSCDSGCTVRTIWSSVTASGQVSDGRRAAVGKSLRFLFLVITGGSDGIGRQYSLFLAERGFKIVIVAMQDDKLVAIKQELESKFQAEVRAFPVDFSKGFEVKDQIEKRISNLDIGILGKCLEDFVLFKAKTLHSVNNVGIGTRFGAYFDSFPLELHRNLINVNIAATVMMSYITLPGMKRRGRGLLINISSVSGLAPVPTVTAYGASKAFIYSFSEALRLELAPFGVEVQTVTPNIVATCMTECFSFGSFGRILSVPVDTFGKFLTMTVGKTGLTTGHWKHGIAVRYEVVFI